MDGNPDQGVQECGILGTSGVLHDKGERESIDRSGCSVVRGLTDGGLHHGNDGDEGPSHGDEGHTPNQHDNQQGHTPNQHDNQQGHTPNQHDNQQGHTPNQHDNQQGHTPNQHDDSNHHNTNQQYSSPSIQPNPTSIPLISPTVHSSNPIQDSSLFPQQDRKDSTNETLTLSDLVPSAISIQDLSVSIQDPSVHGSPVNRRLSSSSMASLDEGSISSVPTYSEKELMNLLRKLRIVAESHLKSHPYAMLPSRYQPIIDKLCNEAATTHYLDSLSLSILSTLLKCMAVRLFQFIQHAYYNRFVGTDLFEYLVSEQCFPSSVFSPRLLRASMYAMDRLKDCEEEIPYLRTFIQEYSQNALELMEPSVVHYFTMTCRQRRINRKKPWKQPFKVQRKRDRIEIGRSRAPFGQWTWRTLFAILAATSCTAFINSMLKRMVST